MYSTCTVGPLCSLSCNSELEADCAQRVVLASARAASIERARCRSNHQLRMHILTDSSNYGTVRALSWSTARFSKRVGLIQPRHSWKLPQNIPQVSSWAVTDSTQSVQAALPVKALVARPLHYSSPRASSHAYPESFLSFLVYHSCCSPLAPVERGICDC